MRGVEARAEIEVLQELRVIAAGASSPSRWRPMVSAQLASPPSLHRRRRLAAERVDHRHALAMALASATSRNSIMSGRSACSR